MKTITYTVKESEYISSAFQSIPTNSNIHKGRCGIGGTNLELNDNRNSIIVVPNLSAMESKKGTFPSLFTIHSLVSIKDIEAYLKDIASTGDYIKIMITPESFKKIIDASYNIGFNVRKECFLLLDESHTIATEGNYRDNIHKVFNYFFEFDNKSTISATPFNYSDERFSTLQSVKITITQQQPKTVLLVFTKDIFASLKAIVNEVRKKGGHVHIFYNSIRSIVEFIDLMGVDGISIFCSRRPENISKLRDYISLLRDTKKDGFAPNIINLYTCGHYEGWDLIDDNATLIMVSDVNDAKTCLNIEHKAIQVVGRLRHVAPKKVYQIININRDNNMELARTKNEIKQVTFATALDAQKIYNLLHNMDWSQTTRLEVISGLKISVEKFCDFDELSGEALINYFKLDNNIYLKYTHNQYLTRSSLIDTWKSIKYSIHTLDDTKRLSKSERKKVLAKRITISESNKLIINEMHQHIMMIEDAKKEGLVYYANDALDELIEKYSEIHKFYITLGYEKVSELGFNSKAMKIAYLTATRNDVHLTYTIANIAYLEFKIGYYYSNKQIKDFLQAIYDKFGLEQTATARHINKYFNAIENTRSINGKATKCHSLIDKRFF